ncbi:MAG: PQQ-binding-like beta-propeller repeat protein [Proteobacteria bacterium]|nr:PQQ-binding-like beta-propeller repeat protein [Pseudomonadota bacterium]
MSPSAHVHGLVVALLAFYGAAAPAAVPTRDDPPPAAEAPPTRGAALYAGYCAKCHDGHVYKAPAKTFLQMMAADAIYAALDGGVMKSQAAALSAADRQAVAEHLAGQPLHAAAPPAAAPRCEGAAAAFDRSAPRVSSWGFDARNSHFIPAEVAKLPAADLPRLRLKWAFAYPGGIRARSQPNVAMGAVFVGSHNGTVYALDAATGCVRWQFRASAEVRTPVLVTPWKDAASRPLAVFGDLIGRVYALDALTGKLRWQRKVEDHPAATLTGAPVFHRGRLYVPVSSLEEAATDPAYPCCSFRGSVVALEARTGAVAWKSYTIDEKPKRVGSTSSGAPVLAPSGAAIWNSPTIDEKRGLLYVGTGDNYSSPANDRSDAILAFDLGTGKLRWSRQVFERDAWNVGCMLKTDNCPKPSGPDFDLGSGTMLVSLPSGRDVILGGLKSGTAFAVDADSHAAPLWIERLGRGGTQGGIQFGMATDGRRLYVPISDMRTKYESEYPGEPRGGIYALDVASGARLWSQPAPDRCQGREFCDPGILAAITAIPGAVIAGHMDGQVRAYAADSGAVLWEYDTLAEVRTVSGAAAHGGSIGGGGPVVANGVLYVNSGYGVYFHLPGNVLLAFSVDGR